MKFAHYLASSQAPEWKQVSIDYKGLKKLIKRLHSPQTNNQPGNSLNASTFRRKASITTKPKPFDLTPEDSDDDGITEYDSKPPYLHNTSSFAILALPLPPLPQQSLSRQRPIVEIPSAAQRRHSIIELPTTVHRSVSTRRILPPIRALNDDLMNCSQAKFDPDLCFPSKEHNLNSNPNPKHTTNGKAKRHCFQSSTRGSRNSLLNLPIMGHLRARKHRLLSSSSTPRKFVNINALYAALSPEEQNFFEKLDQEVEKVDNVYRRQENEVQIRLGILKDQMRQLKEHNRAFNSSRPSPLSSSTPSQSNLSTPQKASKESTRPLSGGSFRAFSRAFGVSDLNLLLNVPTQNKQSQLQPQAQPQSPPPHQQRNNRRLSVYQDAHLDPEYHVVEMRLQKALSEFYILGESLKNYRLLNVQALAKVLKKFDKVSKMDTSELYFREVIDPRPISSGEYLDSMLKEAEKLYADRFSQGDKKTARARLRAPRTPPTYHLSTFRSGLMLGLGMFPLVAGLYESFQPNVREQIPQYSALLQNYATLFIPVLFTVLIGLNMHAWRLARINWVFIFELDVRSAIDARQSFEIPAFLFLTLSTCLWLSFSLLTKPHLDPTLLPVIWLGLLFITLINPLPICYKHTRWWFLRKFGKLFTSGKHQVEFTDFWMGDQLCSFVYTITELYFFSCTYITHFSNPWQKCVPRPNNWVYYWLLASLPNIIRLIQSIRRYKDEKYYIHLINGGKYSSNIISYLVYYSWRGRASSSPYDWHLALWIIVASIMSTYSSLWDLLMDWSVFRSNKKYPFLRSSLLYNDWRLKYYFAIISNVAVRFIWFIYIPKDGLRSFNSPIRSFAVGVLEMLRLWQWNFYRLENEHIGNTDQYRVTDEVPLPYSRENKEAGEPSVDGSRSTDPPLLRFHL